MLPRFFGDVGRQLFGIYHAPATAGQGTASSARGTGVVLCYPAPQEYRQAHWAYRRLAAQLATRGAHVLRFDYGGTGDSAGESTEVCLAQWVDDVATATRELRDVAGVRRVALVGLRLGATIAARACAAGLAVTDLVLWDPVVRGTEYLAGLEAEQTSALLGRRYPEADRVGADELLGYVLPAAMRAELVTLDLLALGCGTPGRMVVIGATARSEYDALGRTMTDRGVACEVRHVADATLADGGHSAHDTLMVQRIPSAIGELLSPSVAAARRCA